jgi:uncharacterized membrane protein YqjE
MSTGLLDSARSVCADLISLGHTRFELFGVELREELGRLATALIGGLAVLVLGALGAAFAALALILFLAPENRMLAASVVAAAFLVAATLLGLKVASLANNKPRPFDATLKELTRDYEAIKP